MIPSSPDSSSSLSLLQGCVLVPHPPEFIAKSAQMRCQEVYDMCISPVRISFHRDRGVSPLKISVLGSKRPNDTPAYRTHSRTKTCLPMQRSGSSSRSRRRERRGWRTTTTATTTRRRSQTNSALRPSLRSSRATHCSVLFLVIFTSKRMHFPPPIFSLFLAANYLKI